MTWPLTPSYPFFAHLTAVKNICACLTLDDVEHASDLFSSYHGESTVHLTFHLILSHFPDPPLLHTSCCLFQTTSQTRVETGSPDQQVHSSGRVTGQCAMPSVWLNNCTLQGSGRMQMFRAAHLGVENFSAWLPAAKWVLHLLRRFLPCGGHSSDGWMWNLAPWRGLYAKFHINRSINIAKIANSTPFLNFGEIYVFICASLLYINTGIIGKKLQQGKFRLNFQAP